MPTPIYIYRLKVFTSCFIFKEGLTQASRTRQGQNLSLAFLFFLCKKVVSFLVKRFLKFNSFYSLDWSTVSCTLQGNQFISRNTSLPSLTAPPGTLQIIYEVARSLTIKKEWKFTRQTPGKRNLSKYISVLFRFKNNVQVPHLAMKQRVFSNVW